jgi:hypothetical protein
MKTFFNINQPPLCREYESGPLSRWSRCLRDQFSSLLVAKKSFFQPEIRRPSAYAVRVILAGLSAVASSATVNWRIYTGLALWGIVTPLSMVAYKLCDKTIDDGSYNGNLYYTLHAMGPFIAMAVFLIGAFHLFPFGKKRAYGIAIPLGFILQKIALIALCTSNEDWHTWMSWPLFVAGILTAITLFISFDHFIWRKYHDFDGKMARLSGLVQISNMTSEEKTRLIKEIENAKSFSF